MLARKIIQSPEYNIIPIRPDNMRQAMLDDICFLSPGNLVSRIRVANILVQCQPDTTKGREMMGRAFQDARTRASERLGDDYATILDIVIYQRHGQDYDLFPSDENEFPFIDREGNQMLLRRGFNQVAIVNDENKIIASKIMSINVIRP